MKVAQSTFRRAVLDAEASKPEGLTDGRGRPAGKRFDVYRNNVAVSLTEALITAFPTIHALVGDDFFRAMSAVFLRQHPPSSPLMMFYGAEMPDFLATFDPVSHLAYLPDIARIDLALRHAYHAADSSSVPPDAFQVLSPDALTGARITLAPSVRIVRSTLPVFDIWQMQRGGPKPGTSAQDALVCRPAYDPTVILLPAGAATFLKTLAERRPLGAAFEAALHETPSFDPTAVLTLALQHGVFADLNTKD